MFMIYDKNQFTFNLIFILVLIATIIINVIFGMNFVQLNKRYVSINKTLSEIRHNQNFNFVQGSHQILKYQLTSQGFFVDSADNFGTFNGPSMQPTIYDGNIVIEKTYSGQSLEEGQIVRFIRDDGTAIIHRVRADYGNSVFVQGDSLKEGEIINKDQITHIIIGVLFT